MESKAKGWAPERERHPWPDSGAGGVRGGLVQAASRSKRGHRVSDPLGRGCSESAEDRAPGERAETDETATATGLLRPVSTLCALDGCSLSRWTG